MNGHALIPPASSLCDNNVGMTGGVKKAPVAFHRPEGKIRHSLSECP